MAEDRVVLGKRAFWHAISRTIEVYKETVEGLGLQLVITGFSLAITASLNGGFAAVLTDLHTLEIVVLSNVGGVLVLFLWHLWLAPYELVMGELAAVKAGVPTAPPAGRSYYDQQADTFKALKNRSKWDVIDLARVLGALDSGAVMAWQETIMDAMGTGALKYIHEKAPWSMDGLHRPISNGTKMHKGDALVWAEGLGFDMSRFK